MPESFYVFFDEKGRPLRAISGRFLRECPQLAEKLSNVPPAELPGHELDKASPLFAKFSARAETGEAAWLFYPTRRDKVETVFSFRDGICLVEKRVLRRAWRGFFRPRYTQLALPPEPLAEGEPADRAMVAAVHAGDFADALRRLENFFLRLLSVFPRDNKGRLPSCTVDALPRNAMENASGALHFFDLEYARKDGVSLSFLIYRAIKMDLLFHLPKKERKQIDFRGEYETLCRKLGAVPQFRRDARESKAFKRFTLPCRFFR